MPLLQKGSTGPDVIRLQQALNSRINAGLPVTGNYGDMTTNAVRTFQKSVGLNVDGVAGNDTQNALYGVSVAGNAIPASTGGPLTLDQLTKMLGNPATASTWLGPLNEAAVEFEINTPLRLAAWLANLCEESGMFTRLVENLNYSAQGLANTWPSRYSTTGKAGGGPNDLALKLQHDQPAIANATYGDRGGNRGTSTSDGWNYRGRTPIQLTGLANYTKYGKELNIDLVNNPDQAVNPAIGARVAGCYWKDNNINQYADKGDFDGCVDMINLGRKTQTIGDGLGYGDRLNYYNKFKPILGA